MEIDIQSDGGEALIRLVGELAGAPPPETYERIVAFARHGSRVRLDLSQVTGVSATGLRKLLSFCRYVKAQGGELCTQGVPGSLLDIVEATGFAPLFRQGSPAVARPLPAVSPVPRLDSYPTHYHADSALRAGFPLPFGATVVPHGINFSVYSQHARSCTLVLFEPGVKEPIAEIPFPPQFRVGDVFAMMVFDLDPEDLEYGYRLEGPFAPDQGHRFDATKVLLDPMARCVSGRDVWGVVPEASHPHRYRARLLPEDFDWEGDRALELPIQDLVIYELHVRGFTRSPSSGVRHPGTFAGLRGKIPYLKELGVNCLELMPVFEFDELDNVRTNPLTGQRLYNYWGYSTVGFYAPNASYAATGPVGMQADELKAMIKELHRNGIEVILDVVFNHTAEGDERGPTISFRGLDNRTYYMLRPDGGYYNFSGCGNTLNCNHPVVRDFVLHCLRHWVESYHIDGFRFDLASILGRDVQGTPLPNPPLVEALAMDPVLAKTKLIAEAWDAGGLYQVGTFPAYGRWAEWNGKYRDCIRRFLKGDSGLVREVSQRLLGSPDLYPSRGPTASINFVTCHDGFTLADLVSYNEKHNEGNGENNQDGANDNHAWNCGVEGPTQDPQVLKLRRRQIKNALAMLFLSQGAPMMLMGDELGRTQLGNNNAFCQDSPITWLDWTLHEKHAELFRFCKHCIAFRQQHAALRHASYPGAPARSGAALDVTWHGTKVGYPDWSPDSRTLAMLLQRHGAGRPDIVYAAFNMYWDDLTFELPPPPASHRWHVFANTGNSPPDDVFKPGREPLLAARGTVRLVGRSCLLLVARPESG